MLIKFCLATMEFAFFGALTSLAHFFIFGETDMKKIDLLEDGEMLLIREYSECFFDSAEAFKKYTDESDILIMKLVKFSDFYEKLKKETLSNLFDFMFECDLLARKMSCGIIFSHSKEDNAIGASILCKDILFCQKEIESLMKLCAFSSQMSFFNSPIEGDGASAEFVFDLSGRTITLANLITHISSR